MGRRRNSGLEPAGSRVSGLLGELGAGVQATARDREGAAERVVRGLRAEAGEEERAEHGRQVAAARELALSEPMARAWIMRSGVGERMAALDIDADIVPSECGAWVANRAAGATMILGGNFGSGKTVAAVWCLRQVYAQGERYAGACHDWRWRPDRTLFTKARDLYAAVFDRNRSALTAARNARVLVIDDLGATYQHEWPLYEIDGLVDARWEGGRATIITTNIHPTEGADSLAATMPRSLDRLCDAPGPGFVSMVRPTMRARHGLEE